MLNKRGLGTLLLVAFMSVSIISIAVQMIVTNRYVSKITTQEALNLLQEISYNYSSTFETIFENGFSLADDVRATLKAFQKVADEDGHPMDRRVVFAYLESMLAENPSVVCIWTAWEPNAFDGQDAQYVGKPGHDASGRLAPYASLVGNEPQINVLAGYDQPGDGDYYQVPLKTGHKAMIEPYEYELAGKTTLLTSLSAPVTENGRVAGATGVDMSLDHLTSMMAGLEPMGVGKVIMISPGGQIVGHSEASFVGKQFSETPIGQLVQSEIDQARSTSTPLVQVKEHGWSEGVDAAISIYPFSPDKTGQNWIFISMVPMDTVLEPSRALIRYSLILGAALLIFAVVAVKLIVGGLTKRILNEVESLERCAYDLNANAGQIAGSSQGIADGAQNQAASLEETSAALEEISSMTKRNAEHTHNTSQISVQTRNAVTAGAQDMLAMSQAMNEINDSAAQIGNIIKTIEEIAFQTNLLALNAAVEAARAGEAGAGFAVVADEVRNLALRSAEAVNSTSSLISATINRVNAGAQVAQRLEDSFKSIENGSKEISELVSQIASATREQDIGIGQVNQSMTVMEKITQESVLTVNDLATSGAKLGQQADELGVVIEHLLAVVAGQK